MRFVFFLLTLLWGISSSAKMTCASIRNQGKYMSEKDFLKPTFAVHKAACLQKQKVKDAHMQTWLEQLGSEPLPWAVVNNVKFTNETPARLAIYQQLTSLKSTNGRSYKIKNDYVILMEPDRPLVFQTECTKVLCAVQEVFGQKEGLRLAYLMGRYGLNASHLRYPSASPFTVSELDEVLMALQDLPRHFFPIAPDMQFTRFLRGQQVDSGVHPCILADSTIRLFDTWENAPSYSKRETIIHELGHAIAQRKLSDVDLSTDWLSLSTWEHPPHTSLTKMKGVHSQEFVSEYAMTQPREDFAESFAAYIYEPDLLRHRNLLKYNFLKDRVFKGHEFTDSLNCPNNIL